MEKTNAIQKAVKEFGGTQSDLARAIGVTAPAINSAIRRGGRMSPENAIKIEEVTGGRVRKSEVCPALARLDGESG